MNDLNALITRAKHLIAEKPTNALVGRVNADNSITIYDEDEPGNIWVRLEGDIAQTYSVLNKKTGADREPNISVWVGRNPRGVLEVLDIDSEQGDFIPKGQRSAFHQPITVKGVGAPVLVNRNEWRGLRVRFNADLTATIEAGTYVSSNGDVVEWIETDLDLSAAVPAAGLKVPVVIGIRTSDNTAQYDVGTAISLTTPPTTQPLFNIATFVTLANASTDADIWLEGVAMSGGMTTFGPRDGVVLRPDAYDMSIGNTLQATLTTTNATVTNLIAYTVAELVGVTLAGRVVAVKSDKTAAYGASFRVTYRRATAGNVTLVGAGWLEAEEDSAGVPAITFDVDIGTQTGRVRWAGILAETWNVKVWYTVITN